MNKLPKPDHEFEKVTNHPDLIRDTFSKGIANTDTLAYENYIQAREHRKNRKVKLEKTVDEINNIKEEMSEMKTMLRQLIDKVNGN